MIYFLTYIVIGLVFFGWLHINDDGSTEPQWKDMEPGARWTAFLICALAWPFMITMAFFRGRS